MSFNAAFQYKKWWTVCANLPFQPYGLQISWIHNFLFNISEILRFKKVDATRFYVYFKDSCYHGNILHYILILQCWKLHWWMKGFASGITVAHGTPSSGLVSCSHEASHQSDTHISTYLLLNWWVSRTWSMWRKLTLPRGSKRSETWACWLSAQHSNLKSYCAPSLYYIVAYIIN